MKILLGYDLSKSAEHIFKLTELHANALKATVDILLSMEAAYNENEIITYEDAEKELSRLKSYFENKNIASNIHISTTSLSPGEDIVNYARDNDIYEIIIGVKKKSRLGKLVMGSTVQYVILNATCPVLTVKL